MKDSTADLDVGLEKFPVFVLIREIETLCVALNGTKFVTVLLHALLRRE